MALDGWIALKSLLPPPERRGVVLVDPPFEEPGELIRMTEGLRGGLERFETGTYLLWYPIKDPKPVARFHRALAEFATTPMLRVELLLRPARNPRARSGATRRRRHARASNGVQHVARAQRKPRVPPQAVPRPKWINSWCNARWSARVSGWNYAGNKLR